MPPPNPALTARALTHRAAAALLTKSPIWSLLAGFMGQQLAALEIEILNNGTLPAETLARRRDERIFLRQTLTDFANQFRSAFTAPPPSEDEALKPMAVPPEVDTALQLLIAPVHARHSPPPLVERSGAADPKNLDPFSGAPL